MESGELLKAENERLIAEMASMKKKIKLALKKQQAELQAKIQAAEQRAAAAEAAAAAGAVNGSAPKDHSQIVAPANGMPGDSVISNSHASMQRESSGSPEINNGEVSHPLASNSELKAETEARRNREYEAARERQRLENEIAEMKKTNEDLVKHRDQERVDFEEKLRLAKENYEQRIENLTKANEKLEVQLMSAAGQVAEAFARMSATHEDLERISKEGNEANRARASLESENENLTREREKLASEHESIMKELEQANASLSEAQKMLRDKTKEIEELAAARKTAQEGQEAAMSRLMERLKEMETAGTGQHVEEATEDRLKSLLDQKAELQQELDKSSEEIRSLREELNLLKQSLSSGEVNGVPAHEEVQSKEFLPSTEEEKTLLTELKAQNESLLIQLEELRSQQAQRDGGDLRALSEATPVAVGADTLQDISVLKEKLQESMNAQLAAEEEMKHLSDLRNKALQKIELLTVELEEGRKKLEDETKSRDEKYAELDAKFGRLQKRAKQRIQEVQKEKEDAEAQLTAAGEKAAQALSKQAALQDELDRSRVQAGEALRSLSAERQELRMTNNKLKEEIEELRRMLDAKEHNLAESRRIASEKDQMVLEMTNQEKELEAKHEAALSDLKEKHQKEVEDLKGQMADGVAESIKLAETISALQGAIAAKESKLAELEAASSGEVVRLGASLEAAKGELLRLEQEQNKEREGWQASLEKLKTKLESTEQALHQQEVETAEMRTLLESELEKKRQALSALQAELVAANEQASRVADDLAAYKVRAYALLQRKEAELAAAKDVEVAAAQEASLKDAKREAAVAAAERDAARKALQEAVSEYETKLAARGVALLDAEQRIKDAVIKLEVTKAQMVAEQVEWQSRLEEVEATWRLRHESLEGKVKDTVQADLRREYKELLSDYENVKREFESFREMVDEMIEDKDKEISRLLEDNSTLHKSLQQQQEDTKSQENTVQTSEPKSQVVDASDAASMVALAEHQILLLARQQAQREEEVSQCRRHIQALQEEIAELERENRLHSQQEQLLKEEVRNLERAHKRDGVDMTYLKNIILKLIETGEVEALLPVIGLLLQFSPEELKRCHDIYTNASTDDKPLRIPAIAETPPSAPSSFFSRLTNFT
ncbi:hypothetical protein R1flu_018348 [Riccia fluitans]|uniref:GRIP domain-containing protein n=1 Tax=Riccia fluitans TaxID=41844 RepID=A0ABD1ZFK5_9MARC